MKNERQQSGREAAMPDRPQLKSIEVHGFKSVDSEGQTIELTPVTVLLGANGAGKSNLVSFFKMLNYMTTGGLQQYVAEQGFAETLLYFGAKRTSTISATLTFESDGTRDEYSFELGRDATGQLFFQNESVLYHVKSKERPLKKDLGGGVKESQLKQSKQQGSKTCGVMHSLLSRCQVFQFHDTSATAKIRTEGYIDDCKFLRSDGGNLAAYLRGLKEGNGGRRYYERIVRHVQLMVPQFDDFDLEPLPTNDKYVRLNWREKDSDYLFGPHQLSDGSLRFMALTTLFLQPPDQRPQVIIVDEPELGLHPAAISALAGMVKAAPPKTQVLLATQSPRLVDEFSADQVLIVERDDKRPRTVFKRLHEEDLKDWLGRYCLSELWEKNVLGGRP
jgi:predicted ATPase